MNPSRYLTEQLSRFLEFDENQLNLGIWSGDLSLKDVSLKSDAINPLLHKPSKPTDSHPLLQIKLLKSTIGHFGFKIPWKQLVWGAGDVHLEVSDLTLVLGYESNASHHLFSTESSTLANGKNSIPTAKDLPPPLTGTFPSTNKSNVTFTSTQSTGIDDSDTHYHQEQRNDKQGLLREAERLQLQGLPLSALLHQTASATTPNEKKLNEEQKNTTSTEKQLLGRLETYVKAATSSFLWRFFAGLKMTVRNVRIVIIQDGVEVGIIVHSVDVAIQKDNLNSKTILKTESNPASGQSTFRHTSVDATTVSSSGTEEEDVGEKQVCKDVQVRGIGAFVRREAARNLKLPKELYFSTSVTADDFILRPAEMDLSFSVYYPPPPGTCKPKTKSGPSKTDKNVDVNSSGATSVGTAVSTASSIARRGKRDRSVASSTESNDAKIKVDINSEQNTNASRGRGIGIGIQNKDGVSFDIPENNPVSTSPTIGTNSASALKYQHRNYSVKPSASAAIASSRDFCAADTRSTPGTLLTNKTGTHVKVALACGDLKTICSSRHYDLAHVFCSSLAKMRNGRPNQTIKSIMRTYSGTLTQHSITVRTPSYNHNTTPLIPQQRPGALKTGGSPTSHQNPEQKTLIKLSLLGPSERSEQSQVVRCWWLYAFKATVWDIRRQKQTREKFREIDFLFDWDKQKHRRKEYVELYILVRLESRGPTEWLISTNAISGEAKLLAMEDELPIEQVLLYRSIARALRVQGSTSMPDKLSTLRPNNVQSATTNVQTPASRLRLKSMNYSSRQSMDGSSFGAFDHDRNYRGDEETADENTFLSPLKTLARTAQHRRDGTSSNPTVFDDFVPNLPVASSQSMQRDEEKMEIRTINTVHTATSSKYKRSNHNSDVPTNLNAIAYSFSVSFQSVECMLYESTTVSRSLLQVPSASVRQVANTESDALDRSENDEVSELSDFSNDFDECDEIDRADSSISGEGGNKEILLSSDFLLFGIPSSLLHLIISTVTVSMDGNSGESRNVSISIGSIGLTGENKCHLLSSGASSPCSPKPPSLSIRRSTNKSGTRDFDDQVQDNLRYPIGPDKAIEVYMVESRSTEGMLINCELSRINISIVMESIMRVKRFAVTSVAYPTSLTPSSGHEYVRNYLLGTDYEKKGQSVFGNLSLALRIHGFEATVPCKHEGMIKCSSSNGSLNKADTSAFTKQLNDGPSFKCTMKFIEVYTGTIVEDLRNASRTSDDTRTFYSAVGTIGSTPPTIIGGKNGLKLRMLDIDRHLLKQQSFACKHSIITLSGIECVINKDVRSARLAYKLLQHPVDLELIVSSLDRVDLDCDVPKYQMVVHMSPIMVVVSKARIRIISGCISDVAKSVLQTDQISQQRSNSEFIARAPRIKALSGHILRAVDMNIARIQLCYISDEVDSSSTSTLQMKEVILEETVTDFLSIISCFDLQFPVEDLVDAAKMICIDRLTALGLTLKEAADCAETSHLNFLADIALMKQARTQVMENFVEVQKDVLKETLESVEEVPVMQESDCSMPDDVDKTSDMESVESMDIIETTIRFAVEKTVYSFLPLIEKNHSEVWPHEKQLVLDLFHGATCTLVKLFYDSHLAFSAPSLSVSNGAGVKLVQIQATKAQEAEIREKASIASLSANNHNIEASTESSCDETESLVSEKDTGVRGGISYSIFELDKGYGFGSGGFPVTVLGSDEGQDDCYYQKREELKDILLGKVDLLFSQKVLEDVLKILSNLTEAVVYHQPNVPNDVLEHSASHSTKVASTFFGHIDHLSLLITSDELAPFARCIFEDINFDQIESFENANRRISAQYFRLMNLTPEGQTYSEVISPIFNENIDAVGGKKAFEMEFAQGQNIWKNGPEVNVTLSSIRVVVVRQFINELLQFFLSKEYGVGLLRSKASKGKQVNDVNGNPPPPLSWKVSLLDSSILFPRRSTCSELLAIEAGKIVIFNSYHASSWILPTESTPLVRGSQEYPSNNSNAPRDSFKATVMTPVGSERSVSIDSEFYDALEGNDNRKGNPDITKSKTSISNFDKEWISRLNVQGEDLQLFTALAHNFALGDAENPRFNTFYGFSGRAAPEKQVYERRRNYNASGGAPHLDINSDTEKATRKWQKITSNPVTIEVIVDYAPHLRLLIADNIGGESAETSLSPPFYLDLRMSQLYLLLSIWYSNMQELPVMFPFSTELIKEGATYAKVPTDFPEYGTESYVDWLKDTSAVKSEIACFFKELAIRCSFDKPGYFKDGPDSLWMMLQGNRDNGGIRDKAVLSVVTQSCFIHVLNDIHGILRLGCGASSLELIDGRKLNDFNRFCSVRNTGGHMSSWADLTWGLDSDGHTFNKVLPQPFQMSLFMTPGWVLVNLGAERLNAIMFEFSPIWILLDYFGGYFWNPVYGHPFFEAVELKDKLKNSVQEARASDAGMKESGATSLKIDFRLWLLHPHLCVPSSDNKFDEPCVCMESETGFWFRFKSLDYLCSMEFGSTNLALAVADEFQSPALRRNLGGFSGAGIGIKNLIEGFSFGARYDTNKRDNHMSVSVRIPFLDNDMNDPATVCKPTSPDIEAECILLPPPAVCVPVVQPLRHLGSTICEITLILEVLPLTSSLFLNLLTGPSNESNLVDETKDVEAAWTFDVSTQISGLRVFLIDPVLGMHLPVAVLSVCSLGFTASQLGTPTSEESNDCPGIELPAADLQVVVDSHFWADYFKLGVTRSWEPLFEPYKCLILYEKSSNRGQGLSLMSESPFQLNITGALMVTLDETINTLKRSLSETFGGVSTTGLVSNDNDKRLPVISSLVSEKVDSVVQQVDSSNGGRLFFSHQIPKPLKANERVAFSFRNLTGQRIRIHQPTGAVAQSGDQNIPVIYLDHVESTKLVFDATMSVFRNLDVVEVPFPGLEDSSSERRSESDKQHTVDMQIPGFKWLRGISVDSAGRKFNDLSPRSQIVLSKVKEDWRLDNCLKLLTEVGLENGGRFTTVRSLFEIRNNTSHLISLMLNPDPRYIPVVNSDVLKKDSVSEGFTAEMVGREEENVEQLQSGDSYLVPTLLLESSLHLDGSHLGSLWIRPSEKDECQEVLDALVQGGISETGNTVVGFSSRPIQLAKIVHESAVIFGSSSGHALSTDTSKSGFQVSCPISKREVGVSVAPFCYVVEIRRSPLTRPFQKDHDDVPRKSAVEPYVDLGHVKSKEQESNKKTRFQKTNVQDKYQHGPVTYSLTIHPPLVIENLLPQGGRFELMHATRQSVLWFADLKPGERVPVHSVGLDAPLVLSINLGFCRTPVGEGALVHHGSDLSRGKGSSAPQNVGFKTIGKVVTKGTKQIGKTLTSISDSPDKRGQGKLNTHMSPRKLVGRKDAGKRTILAQAGDPMGLETDFIKGNSVLGKVHRVESQFFTPEDVASETTVVDSIGQRLSLSIENIRGGGGQRRISLFAPFWMINTTEHSLRYKQEKSSSFVSGTVLGALQDGSKPVDGSNRNRTVIREKQQSPHNEQEALTGPELSSSYAGTLFSGKPGALATSLGESKLDPATITKLIAKDLSLDYLSRMAFMFNFQEDVLSLGHQKLCVQLGDSLSRYTSDFSSGFSLDSVGVTQVVGMHCKGGRALEIAMTISVAPGVLSQYTKIVRFLPRYILVNQLKMPLRIWQDSSLLHQNDSSTFHPREEVAENKNSIAKETGDGVNNKVNQYESVFGRPVVPDEFNLGGIPVGTTANLSAEYINVAESSALVPFHLPDTRGNRQLRIDLGYPWNLTPSFSSDMAGEYTLRITRAFDLSLLRHVTTRASPRYTVVLPPPDENENGEEWNGELGVWFETDWGGDKKIIVKGMKRGRYSFNHTDIHVGDELLYIDGDAVSGIPFPEVMKILKERVAQVALLQRGRNNAEGSLVFRPVRRLTPKIGRKGPTDIPDSGGTDRLILTFRTVEERLRRVRVKAVKKQQISRLIRKTQSTREKNYLHTPDASERERTWQDEQDSSGESNNYKGDLKVEMRTLHGSIFVVVRSQDLDNPPFRIENRSRDNTIYFRQRGCEWHPWNIIKPGESRSYSWEEPLKPKKLTVRAAANNVALFGRHVDNQRDTDSNDHESIGGLGNRYRKVSSVFQYVDSEESGGLGSSRSIKLEEIGFTDIIPCPGAHDVTNHIFLVANFLQCQVDTDGATRVLVVSDKVKEESDDQTIMQMHLSTLHQEIEDETGKIKELRDLKILLNQTRGVHPTAEISPGKKLVHIGEKAKDSPDSSHTSATPFPHQGALIEPIESEAKDIVDLPEDTAITRCHQVVIQVLEATGLKSSDFSGTCNPYCEIRLKGRLKKKRGFFSNAATRRTYYIEKTPDPKWSGQVFVFDVPPDAANVTRGHSVRLRLRQFRFIGHDTELGQCSVQFRSLRNQRELIGWYPLMGRTGSRELEDSGKLGRGSVKLRVQWIFTVPALVDYYFLMSERRLGELQQSREGMVNQLAKVIASDKSKKILKEKFAIARIPKMLGLQNSIEEKKPRGSDDDETRSLFRFRRNEDATPQKRNWTSQSLLDNVIRRSDDKYLWNVYTQTAKSKQARRQRSSIENNELQESSNVTQMARERLDSITEMSCFETLSLDSIIVTAAPKEADIPQVFPPSSPQSKRLHSLIPFNPRARSDSLPTMTQECDEDIPLFETRRRRAYSRDTYLDGYSSLPAFAFDIEASSSRSDTSSDVDAESSKLETERMGQVDALFREGLVYHLGGSYFHRRHLPYHFRQSLLPAAPVRDEDSHQNNFHPKSTVRSSLSLHKLKTWTAAQAVVNDKSLFPSIASIETKEKMMFSFTPKEDNPSFQSPVPEMLLCPDSATTLMLAQARSRAHNMSRSREQFERACKRSLQSVLNPGGWLTIRPLTALNLPDSFTGMSVKVGYGSFVKSSKTADARVTPRWANDDHFDSTSNIGHLHKERNFRFSRPESDPKVRTPFRHDDNDLSFFVEPLRTSGSLRLSVIAERLNQKVEIGVLDIPLGSAIKCCIEEIGDHAEETAKELGEEIAPMYVRWFPLMNPKESEAVEGDMGLSSRPMESEKVFDNEFSRYFAPCIKLALIWEPDLRASKTNNDIDQIGIEDSSPANVSTILPVRTKTYFNADIGRISIAVVDSQRSMELLSISTSDVDVRYSVTAQKTRFSLAIGWLQIDQQGDYAREPVVLAPTPVAHPHPTLQLLVVRDNLRTKRNIESYEYVAVVLQEMDLTIEESWMFDLWDFFMSVVRRREVSKKTLGGSRENTITEAAKRKASFQRHATFADNKEASHSENDDFLFLLDPDKLEDHSDKVYVEQLMLGFIKVNLTYLKGKKQDVWQVTERGDWVSRATSELAEINVAVQGLTHGISEVLRIDIPEEHLRWSENTHEEDLWTEDEGTDNASRNLPGTIASVFPSVSDARIRLQGKVIEYVLESPSEILASLQNYYVSETLKQIYKIIGSLDFAGNPSMVFNSFVTGVRDFISAPSKELIRNPKQISRVGVGCAKGTLSLFSHSASGLFGFSSKIFASVGQAAALLSCDEDYIKWHRDYIVAESKTLDRRWKKSGHKKLTTMIGKPIEDIMFGVLTGVTGVIVAPYKGAVRGGGEGCMKGVAIGALGIAVKPLVGIFDAFSHCTGSIHDVAKSVNVLEKRYQPARKLRFPNIFGLKNVLLPFNLVTARSVHFLRKHPMKDPKEKNSARRKTSKAARREIHVSSEVLHMEAGVETYVVASTSRIVLFKVRKDTNNTLLSSIGWEVDLTQGGAVSSGVQDEGHNGVSLTIVTRDQKVSHVGLPSTPKDLSHDLLPNTKLDPIDDEETIVFYDTVTQGSILDVSGIDLSALGIQSNRLFMQDESTQEASTKGIREWFRVQGEFQHRRQLIRLHNAVCCITGNLDDIMREQGLGLDGSLEGYTNFGQVKFGNDFLEPALLERPREDKIYSSLEVIPWVPAPILRATMHKSYMKQTAYLVAKRDTWLFSTELEASAKEGGPTWMIEARARARFISRENPLLPAHIHPKDSFIGDIFTQLEEGNISYIQASGLVNAYAETMELKEDCSVDSLHLDDIFSPSAGSKDDLFRSAVDFDQSMTPQNNAMVDSISGERVRLSLGQAVPESIEDEQLRRTITEDPDTPSDMGMCAFASTATENREAFLSPLDISTNHETGGANPNHGFDVSDNLRVSRSGTLMTVPEKEDFQKDFQKDFQRQTVTAGDISADGTDSSQSILGDHKCKQTKTYSTKTETQLNPERDFQSTEPDLLHAKIDRLEVMMEHLLLNNGVLNEMSSANTSFKESAAKARYRQLGVAGSTTSEITVLRDQLFDQRKFYEDALATAALRQEVSDLRREVAGVDGYPFNTADATALRHEVDLIKKQLGGVATSEGNNQSMAVQGENLEISEEMESKQEVKGVELTLLRDASKIPSKGQERLILPQPSVHNTSQSD